MQPQQSPPQSPESGSFGLSSVRLQMEHFIFFCLTFDVSHAGQRQLPGVGCENWLGSSSFQDKWRRIVFGPDSNILFFAALSVGGSGYGKLGRRNRAKDFFDAFVGHRSENKQIHNAATDIVPINNTRPEILFQTSFESQIPVEFSRAISGELENDLIILGAHFFCPTSKMSHEWSWRDSCASTRHDRSARWLWRLVRPIGDSSLMRQLLEKRPIESLHVVKECRGPLLPSSHVTDEKRQEVPNV